MLHSDVHGLGRVAEIVLESVHAIGHRELGLIDSGVRGKKKGYPFAMEVKEPLQLRFIYPLSTRVTSNAIGWRTNVVESHVSIQTSNGETVGRGVVLDRDDALIMLCVMSICHFHLSDLISLCGVGSQIP